MERNGRRLENDSTTATIATTVTTAIINTNATFAAVSAAGTIAFTNACIGLSDSVHGILLYNCAIDCVRMAMRQLHLGASLRVQARFVLSNLVGKVLCKLAQASS